MSQHVRLVHRSSGPTLLSIKRTNHLDCATLDHFNLGPEGGSALDIKSEGVGLAPISGYHPTLVAKLGALHKASAFS